MKDNSTSRSRSPLKSPIPNYIVEDDTFEPPAIHIPHSSDENADTTSNDSTPSEVGEDVDHEEEYKPSYLTWRAMIIGCILGTIFSGSNMYMGLKSGWGFGNGTLLGAIFGYPILKWISRLDGMPFGIREHVAACSVATGATGLSAGWISGIPAMFRMGLFGPPEDFFINFPRFVLYCSTCALFGVFLTVPLRRWFLERLALPFPSAIGAAEIIKSFHRKSRAKERTRISDEKLLSPLESKQSAIRSKGDRFSEAHVLLYTIIFTVVLSTLGLFIVILRDIHINYYIYKLTQWEYFKHLDLLYFSLSFDWAFLGAGMMVGPTVATSCFMGSFFGWAVLGYILEAKGILTGKYGWETETIQRFLLWPGIAVMVTASLSDFVFHIPSIVKSLWAISEGTRRNLALRLRHEKFEIGSATLQQHHIAIDSGLLQPSPSFTKRILPDAWEIPRVWWVGGTILSTIYCCVALYVVFAVPILESMLAIVVGMIFAYMCVQANGETDINPGVTLAKGSQLIFSSIPQPTIQAAQTVNSISGIVTLASSYQAAELIRDLKTGHILNAPPRDQFLAQLVGNTMALISGVAFFSLFVKAYPCILINGGDQDPVCLKSGMAVV